MNINLDIDQTDEIVRLRLLDCLNDITNHPDEDDQNLVNSLNEVINYFSVPDA